jgi:hypothetical protein
MKHQEKNILKQIVTSAFKDMFLTMLVGMWRNRNPYTLLVGMQISTVMESSMEIPQKAQDRTAI